MKHLRSAASMNRRTAVAGFGLAGLGLAAGALGPQVARAANASSIASASRAALAHLYASNAKAKALGAKARAVLVFPNVVKAGAVVGGLRGEGAMLRAGKVAGYYSVTAASYGLQLGAQRYAYALFFMTESALAYLTESKG